MHHVFISYSRRDGVWVGLLVEALGSAGIDVWIDRRDIPVSIPWLDAIRDAVEESDLFLICESEHWQSSDACAAEDATALEFEKATSRVAVGSDVGTAVEAVRRERSLLSEHVTALVELRVRARDWDRAGEPRSLLVPHQATRSWRSAADRLGMPTPQAEAYLRACHQRSARISGYAVTSVVLVVFSVVALALFGGTHQVASMQSRRALSGSNQVNRSVATVQRDPYEGLRIAANRGGEESAYNTVIVEAALASPVPDDAFRAGRRLVRFAEPTVGPQVTAIDGAGGRWGRGSRDRDVRRATLLPEHAGSGERRTGTGPLQTFTKPGSGVVEVREDGRLVRVLTADDGPAVAVAGSPDGHRVAVASAASVSVFDVDSGQRRVRLVGSPAELSDVVWSTDGRAVWAIAGRDVLRWSVADASVVLDEPGTWFQAIAPSGTSGEAWLVARDGELRRVDLSSGRTIDRIEVDDEIYAVSTDPTGGHIVLAGEHGDHLVDLHTGRSKQLHIEDCEVGRGAWMPDGSGAALPCLGGPLVLIDENGRELSRVSIGGGGASTVAIPPSLDIFVGGRTGEVFRIPADGDRPELLETAPCRTSVNALGVDEQGSVAVPVGDGQGQLGCFRRGLRKGESWTWDANLSADEAGTSSTAVAVTGDGGTFAVGLSDGTIQLRPTVNILPRQHITSLAGAARSFLGGADGALYVVTRAGQLARIPDAASVPSAASFAHEAAQRLARARELGLAT